MTSLIVYGTNVASSTLSTASDLATTTGGTLGSKTTTSPNDSSANYMEVYSLGGTGTDSASLPSPSGKGWLLDATTLEGNTISAGNWSGPVRLNVTTGTMTASLIVRFYKRSSGGTYTSIGTITLTSQSLTTTTTSYSFPATSLSSMAFATGDKLYIDFFVLPSGGSTWTGQGIKIITCTTATQGDASNFAWTTPGYVLSGTVVDHLWTTRGRISAIGDHLWTTRARLSAIGKHLWTTRGNVGNQTHHLWTTRGRLAALGDHLWTTRARVSAISSHLWTTRGNIIARNLSGGFTLWANGTGVASFDHFRATEYPDPALCVSAVLPQTNSSEVIWTENVPANTARTMYTSIDGVNFTDVTASNGGTIPGITSQSSVVTDVFTSNTSASYSNTSKSGGSTATWTYDTTNSRITASGGSSALYLYTALSANNVDVLCDMDKSDAGGLAWCVVDVSDYYELGVYDDSSSGGFTNQLRLYKVVSGTRSLLSSAAITFPRSTPGTSPYHRIRVIMLSGTITAYFDGATIITYTDGSPLGSGQAGMRNDGGTSRYYQFRAQALGSYVSGSPAGDIVTSTFVYTKQALSSTDPTVTPQILDLITTVRSPSIDAGALIPQLHTVSTPTAVMFNKEFDALAQMSGDYHWNVDLNGYLSFNLRGASVAPWPLYSTDLQFGGGAGSSSVVPSSSADLYITVVKVINCVFTTSQTEQKVADGTATSWTMAYPLYSAPTITIGGVVQSVGVQGVDTGKMFYWQAASASISQDSSATKLVSGTILTFAYTGAYINTVTQSNATEEARAAGVEQNTGIIENVIDGASVFGNGQQMTSAQATTYAQGLLTRFANNNAVDLTATTRRSGLAVGMLLPVWLPEHQLSNRQLLVTKVTTTGQLQADGSVLYFYQIEATDGANLQNWTQALFGL